jgi:hypothetical protein
LTGEHKALNKKHHYHMEREQAREKRDKYSRSVASAYGYMAVPIPSQIDVRLAWQQ